MANEIVLDKEIATCSIYIEHSRIEMEIRDRPVDWDVRRAGAESQRPFKTPHLDRLRHSNFSQESPCVSSAMRSRIFRSTR
jgi:hypothetical protein